jgi:TRAP-type C4-dicarboxylate transport system permease small subunit
MSFIRALERLSDITYRASKVLIIIGLALVVIFVAWQVFTRYFLNDTAVWATEASVLSMVWMLYLGCAIGLRDGEVVYLTLLLDRLQPVSYRVVKVFGDLVLMGFLIIMIVLNTRILELSSTTPMPVLQISKVWVYSSLTVGFSLMVLYTIVDISKVLTGRRVDGSSSEDEE